MRHQDESDTAVPDPRYISPLAGPLALILIALLGLGFLITRPEGLFNPYSDLVSQQLATQTLLHDAWTERGTMPLWRTDQLSGGPAFTNPQATYSHPLHLFFALFVPVRIVGLVLWLELILAALGGYAAASALGLSRPARLMTAVGSLFSFKTLLAVYAGWLPVLASIAAVPFLFATTLRVVERPSVRTVLASAAAGTLALHAGHPQLVYYAVVLLAVWMPALLLRQGASGTRRAALTSAGALALAAAAALGLSAYRWLPILSDVSLVTRPSADASFFFGRTPFPAWGLLTLFHPEFFGSARDGSLPEAWEYVLYLGIVPSLLAVAGGVWGRRRPHVTALRLAVLVTALLAIDSPVVRWVADVVPGYGLFRMPARILFVTAFFCYGLAGVGLDELLRRVTPGRRTLVAALLISLTAIEGTYWARRYLQTPTPVPYPVRADYLDTLRSPEPARVASLSSSLPSVGSAAALGLELVTGYDPFNFTHYQTYMDLLQHGRALGTRPAVWITLDDIARWDLVDALNVRTVVSPQPIDPGPGFSLVRSFEYQPQFSYYVGLTRGPVYVYRNDQFNRRAFFVDSVQGADDEREMLARMRNVNARSEAVVLRAPAGASAPSPSDRVDVRQAAAGRLAMAVRNASRRFLVVSEVWHPGWSATVNGQPASIVRADIALQGLWLEPGEHDVVLTFWPTGLSEGLATTGITAGLVLVAIAIAAIGSARRRRT